MHFFQILWKNFGILSYLCFANQQFYTLWMMVIVPRIAVVSCFSTTPFIYGIQHEDNLRAGLLLSDPAEAIQAFSEHKADIALVPAAAVPSLTGARIDKVQQPARDQIVLLLRGNLRLLLNAGPNQPRVQLTEVLRENPAEPPMLCMLLRKHLVGGRITEIEQSGLERIVTFTVRSVNELGESGTKKLVLEAMGRRSNLLLLDEDDRILDCMRRVEFEVSGAR